MSQVKNTRGPALIYCESEVCSGGVMAHLYWIVAQPRPPLSHI